MHALGIFLLLAGSYWQTKQPSQWTDEELRQFLTDSPWAQMAEASRGMPGASAVAAFLATAKPVRLAEKELRRRFRNRPEEGPLELEYREFLEQNDGKVIILALRLPNPDALGDAAESRRMEEETVLHIGRRKYKISGSFPPAGDDPYLRLVFPRDLHPDDKRLVFEIYVPSASAPYRNVEFALKDLLWEGNAEP